MLENLFENFHRISIVKQYFQAQKSRDNIFKYLQKLLKIDFHLLVVLYFFPHELSLKLLIKSSSYANLLV